VSQFALTHTMPTTFGRVCSGQAESEPQENHNPVFIFP
jgi:hypothetical protein